MRLLPIPDSSGKPDFWINPDHLVSVQAQYRASTSGRSLAVELKVDGMPLHRVSVGEYESQEDAEKAFMAFMEALQPE